MQMKDNLIGNECSTPGLSDAIRAPVCLSLASCPLSFSIHLHQLQLDIFFSTCSAVLIIDHQMKNVSDSNHVFISLISQAIRDHQWEKMSERESESSFFLLFILTETTNGSQECRFIG